MESEAEEEEGTSDEGEDMPPRTLARQRWRHEASKKSAAGDGEAEPSKNTNTQALYASVRARQATKRAGGQPTLDPPRHQSAVFLSAQKLVDELEAAKKGMGSETRVTLADDKTVKVEE